jgi:hypothetical protein
VGCATAAVGLAVVNIEIVGSIRRRVRRQQQQQQHRYQFVATTVTTTTTTTTTATVYVAVGNTVRYERDANRTVIKLVDCGTNVVSFPMRLKFC